MDKQHKLIRQYTISDAAVHDSQMLEAILLPAEAGRDVWADSAYRSDAIKAHLTTTGLRSKLHHNGYRNKNPWQHTSRRTIGAALVFERASNMSSAIR